MKYQVVIGDNTLSVFSKDQLIMEIRERISEGIAELSLSGELRSDISQVLEDELLALASVDLSISVSCSELRYISAASIKAFIEVEKAVERNNNTLKLVQLTSEVFLAFEKTGANDLLLIEKGEQS